MSDLTLPLIGLTALAGFFFSKEGKNSRKIESLQNELAAFEKPNGKNIYTSNVVDEANRDILERSLKNYQDAENPEITGFIPPFYNAFRTQKGNKDILEGKDRDMLTYSEIAELDNINRNVDVTQMGKSLSKLEERPMFKEYGEYLSGIKKPAEEEKIGNTEISLLTGKSLDRNHNNMVPFFGGAMKQNVETFSNESLLDLYSGNTSTFQHKKEVGPLFNQTQENIYGSPLFTNNVEMDRYNQSVFRQNEKPFDPVRINALKANTIENNILPQYKDVNDLNVKQKETYGGRVLSGKQGEERGILGDVKKRRPETFYEQTQDHLFKGPGQFIGIKSEEDYTTGFKNTARADYNTEYFGIVGQNDFNKLTRRVVSIDNSDEILDAIAQNPKRTNYENDYMRNVSGIKSADDYGLGAIRPVTTERTSTGEGKILNPYKSERGSRAQLQDEIKGTLRQDGMNYQQIGNVKTTFDMGLSKSHDVGIAEMSAKDTQKQTLVDNKYITPINMPLGMGYVVNKYDAKPTTPIHALDYVGIAEKDVAHTSRLNYDNAEIRDHQEIAVSGERPSGPEKFQIASGTTSYGDIQHTDNMALKEQEDQRDKDISKTYQTISNKNSIGVIDKDKIGMDKNMYGSRLEPEILGQLLDNPYVNK